MRGGSTVVLAAVLAIVALSAPRDAAPVALASTLDRPADPVVMTGAAVPSFAALAPGDLVAFRYFGGWHQIPVQVDERAMKNFADIYDNVGLGGGAPYTTLVYTDTGTFTGADPVTTIDSDDEIVFMAKDAGDQPPAFSEPAGVITQSGVEVTVTDPLAPLDAGHVYLFEQDGSLDPSAGEQYVTYTFNLLSGPYLTTYNTVDGPNAEDSEIATAYYERHFGDRWLDDELRVVAGASTGVDILDRHKALFAPGSCGRSEDTFNNGDSGGFPGEGAFIVNKSGPVRAIRSWLGANSGPRTLREHVFYERRQDVRTFLRVHTIPSVIDFYDYSPAASGMTYYNDLNTGGVTIDGTPEVPAPANGAINWEMVEGAQGSVVMSFGVSTNIGRFAYTSYYLDDSTPPVTQCTGDAFAYGASGIFINQQIPCTDPPSCTNFMNPTRTIYYDAPGLTTGDAAALHAEAQAPLEFTTEAWESDTDGDGVGDGADNCLLLSNPSQTNSDSGPPPPAGDVGGWSNGPTIPLDDRTVANGDGLGDACDPDNDNDGRTDADELAGTGCGGAVTNVSTDNAYASLSAPGDGGTSWDSDGDVVPDGVECALATDPLVATGGAGGSADRGACNTSAGGNADDDGDGVLNQWEVCKWGTLPSGVGSANSDGDALTDCEEILDVNGNGQAAAADGTLIARAVAGIHPDGDMAALDINGNGAVAAADRTLLLRLITGIDPSGGNCT
jgi:hypothetical protein